MKRFLFLLMAVFASFHLQAQQQSASAAEKFFQKYENDRNFTVVTITPKMFGMFAKLDTNDPDSKNLMGVIKKLKGLRILARENTKDGSRLFKEAAAFLGGEFEELMTVRDKGSDLKFMVRENSKGNINELIMLVNGSDEFMVMSLYGEIDLNEISQIAGAVNIQGMDKLKNVKKK